MKIIGAPGKQMIAFAPAGQGIFKTILTVTGMQKVAVYQRSIDRFSTG